MKYKRPAAINIGIEIDPDAIRCTVDEIRPDAEIAQGDAAAASLFVAMQSATVTNSDGRRHLVTPPKTAIIDASYFFICGDAFAFFDGYPFTGREFVYLDPPYLLETRASARPIYNHEMTRAQHVQLLEIAKMLPCPVMISGYASDLYNQHLGDWQIYQYDAQTRGGTMAREYLWMNYPDPEQLHDYQYLGDDYRERERIKRKKERWVNRFQSLDTLERKAILWAIREAGIIQ